MLDKPDQRNREEKLRILIAASEAVPWSKTGGLADVSTALAKSLDDMGHDVTLVVPYHRQTKFAQANARQIFDSGTELRIPVGGKLVHGKIFGTEIPNSNVRMLLIDQLEYFDRPGIYNYAERDFEDNCARFVFFSRAVIETAKQLVLRPDVIHANDWQTGLIPALLEIENRTTPGLKDTGSVFTIHNLAYQGWFPSHELALTGLDWKYFNWQQMECYDQLNLLKTGLAFANQITTVSPTYAKEIQDPRFGCGLEGLLSSRVEDLTGILNGIDPTEWSPEVDPLIEVNYNVDCVDTEKPKCKAFLQDRVGLPNRPKTPLFGMVSRMTDQKGFDLILQSAYAMLEGDVQLVVLGSGDSGYENMFRELARRFPDKVAVKIGFNEQLAHQIEAGADFYLMPSRFEPCGLNQMYSLAYGTVPLVRSTGGLADSVIDVTSDAIRNKTATGVVFNDYDAASFFEAFQKCLALYRESDSYLNVAKSGMKRDSTWQCSAAEYASVYHRAMAAKKRLSN